MSNPINSRTCLSCNHSFNGNYCNNCGEKVIGPEDRKLKKLLQEFGSALFNLDNKFLKTLKLVFSRPAQLSENYVIGNRKNYFKPSSLYILLTVIYFIFAPFELFVPTIKTHTQYTGYTTYAEQKIATTMEAKSITREALENRYNAIAPGISKWLILLYIPALGAMLWILFFKSRPFIADHFLLSVEINIYNLFAHFILLPIVMSIIVISMRIFGITIRGINDSVLLPIIGLSMFRYTLLGFRRFYQQKWWITLLKTIVFMLALGSFAFTVYRFMLFWIAMKMV